MGEIQFVLMLVPNWQIDTFYLFNELLCSCITTKSNMKLMFFGKKLILLSFTYHILFDFVLQ